MAKLTNVSCIYTGGNIYVYQALYDGKYWMYGSLDEWMDAYSYEPLKYQQETESSETPEDSRVPFAEFPTWQEVIDSLAQDDAYIFGDADECIDIIKEWQDLDSTVDT